MVNNGKIIKEIREKRGLTQKKFALILTEKGYKTGFQNISNFERNGLKRFKDFERICNIFDFDVNYNVTDLLENNEVGLVFQNKD